MSQSLPITFSAMQGVFSNEKLALTLLPKLEAWLNFETMKKSWYGDEDMLVNITLYLLSPEKIAHYKNSVVNPEKTISDQPDTIIYTTKSVLDIVALFTLDNEKFTVSDVIDENILEETLSVKLIEILNLIAIHYKLDTL